MSYRIEYQFGSQIFTGFNEETGEPIYAIEPRSAAIICEDEVFERNLEIAKNNSYEGTEPVWTYIPYTEEEARAKRDKLLAATDWTQTLDAPIDATTREAYRAYRQVLRDIPEQPEFPDVIEWPELPEVVKAAPDPVDTAVDAMLEV